MKIDLHCHTKCIKKGDGIGRNVTKELFRKEYIKNAINYLEKIDYQNYIDEQDSKELLKLIQILSNKIDKKLFGSLCEKYSIYLTNYSINKIKSMS